jgi:hypothetical protein
MHVVNSALVVNPVRTFFQVTKVAVTVTQILGILHSPPSLVSSLTSS